MDWLLPIGDYWSKKFLKISFVSLLCNLLIVIYIVLNTESLIQIRQAVILSELQCMIKPRMEQFWKLHPRQSNDMTEPVRGLDVASVSRHQLPVSIIGSGRESTQF